MGRPKSLKLKVNINGHPQSLKPKVISYILHEWPRTLHGNLINFLSHLKKQFPTLKQKTSRKLYMVVS